MTTYNNYKQTGIQKEAARLQAQMNGKITVKIDLTEDLYENLGLSESGKAQKIKITCVVDSREDGEAVNGLFFYVPVSIIKNNIIPAWFVGQMFTEKQKQGIFILSIINKN